MIPQFEPGGNLPPGVHRATWSELYDRFGTTRHAGAVGCSLAFETLWRTCMIKNERQYRITRAQADRFSEALRKLDAGGTDQSESHPRLLTVQKEALKSQLSDLEADIREYEALKAGDFAFEQLASISELPKLLIRARIASGLSQRALADRLGLKEQQIQRFGGPA